jgi:O-antigen/teichoic acid export membrane protein
MFWVYSGIGAVCYLAAIVMSFLLGDIFHLDPEQAHVGRLVLLITATQVALYFPFSVFGGVINGFERYYVNNIVGTASNVLAALGNVVVLWLGYGLVELVATTTAIRVLPFLIYRLNAYWVFPELKVSFALFRRDRLRELTGFSVYLAVIDWATRICYATDAFVIGIFMNTAAVGVYAVGQRLSDAMLKVTNQLHTLLFPAVVHRAVAGGTEGQRDLMVKATRFQLAIAIGMCSAAIADADVLIRAWVGPGWESSVVILQQLAYVVILRAWMAMPSTVLKGTNHHKYVAVASSWSAVANLLLSVALVKPFGVVGVSLGTVIPATVLSAVNIFPRACRVVGMTVWDGYRGVVWPAAWPAAITLAALIETRYLLPVRTLAVLFHMGLGALTYAALFFLFGLPRDERRWFTSSIADYLRRRRPAPAAAA